MKSNSSIDGPQPTEAEELLFHRIFNQHGGLLDLRKLPCRARNALMDLRWRAKMFLDSMAVRPEKNQQKRINFNFISNEGINAVARIQRKRCFAIGFYIGMVRRIYEVCFALLCTDFLFPEFGNPSREDISPQQILRVILGADEPACYCESDPSSGPASASFARILPTDGNRQWFAHLLASMAFEYLLYHEFFHVWSGHLEFAVENQFGLELCEGPCHTQIMIPPDVAQTLEFDADKTAAWMLARIIPNQHWTLHGTMYRFPHREQLFRSWAMINGIVFVLLEQERRRLDKLHACYHPEPSVRFWCLYSFFEQSLLKNDANDVPIWRESFHLAMADIKKIWTNGGQPDGPFKVEPAEVEHAINTTNEFSKKVVALHPKLKPHDFRQIVWKS